MDKWLFFISECIKTDKKLISLVWFYGILTIVSYLIQNPVFTYILVGRLSFMAYQPL